MDKLKVFFNSEKVNAAFILVIIAYLIPRLFFYFGIPLPGIDSDSVTYWRVAYEMEDGGMPMFNIRTPGYPIVIYLLSKVTDSLILICLFQSVVFFVSFSRLYRVLVKYFPKVKWYLTAAFILFLFAALHALIMFLERPLEDIKTTMSL